MNLLGQTPRLLALGTWRTVSRLVRSVHEGFAALDIEHKAAVIAKPSYTLKERAYEFIAPFSRAER